MLRSESSSRMWIDVTVVSGLLPMSHVYSQSDKQSSRGSVPLPLGFVTYSTLADYFCRLKGRGGRCEIRHGNRGSIECGQCVDEDVVKNRRWLAGHMFRAFGNGAVW